MKQKEVRGAGVKGGRMMGGGRGYSQGRTQDLSEGGARFIKEPKNSELGTKNSGAGEIFF